MDQRPDVGTVAYLKNKNQFIYYLITKEYSNSKPTYFNLTAAIKKLLFNLLNLSYNSWI